MKILIAEDSVELQRAYQRLLEREHTLLLEDNPADAIRQLLLDPDIELVISDYQLIDGTGEDIYHFVCEHRPQVPFLLVSGHVGDVGMPRATRLFKPIDADELRSRIGALR